MSFLASIENTAWPPGPRIGLALAYPAILFLHTVGLGFLVGLNAAIDLRILGAARRLPLAPMESFYASCGPVLGERGVGTLLLMADATTKLVNRVFYIKMTFVFLAVVNMVLIRRRYSVIRQSTRRASRGSASARRDVAAVSGRRHHGRPTHGVLRSGLRRARAAEQDTVGIGSSLGIRIGRMVQTFFGVAAQHEALVGSGRRRAVDLAAV